MRRPGWWAVGLALLFAVALSDSLLRIPIQSSDSLELILEAQRSPSVSATFVDAIGSSAYMRPLFRAQNKLIFDLAGEDSLQPAYRGVHAFLILACLTLFATGARVRTWSDCAAFAMALGVLLGIHTFRGAVGEAYPVNHYLNVAVVCLVTLVLAQSRGGLGVDLLAVAGFVYAIFILETGALVWVVALAAWTTGWRGISSRGLAAMTVALAGYAILRFVLLPTGLPTLSERSTGFLFSALDPPELNQRFGQSPMFFYAYNVAVSFVSVLLSEPRAGRFVATYALLHDRLTPHMLIMVTTSLLTTGAIAGVAWRAWRRRTLDDNARYLVVFGAVIAANSVVSFPYTKDEIMLPAGIFYAFAAYAAARAIVHGASLSSQAVRAVAMIVLFVVSMGWAARASGLPYFLRSQAFKQRGDWAELSTSPSTSHSAATADELRLLQRLRDNALATGAPNPYFAPRWQGLLWEE